MTQSLFTGRAQRRWTYAARVDVPRSTPASQPLTVTVIFTNKRQTGLALAYAQSLAEGLGAKIQLLLPHVVPYPLALCAPSVAIEHLEREALSVTRQSGAEIDIAVRLCREPEDAVLSWLEPGSLVVLCSAKRRTGAERRLARALTHHGHHVVFADGKGDTHDLRPSLLRSGVAVLRRMLGIHAGV